MMTEDQLSRADKMRIRRAVQTQQDWQKANPAAPDVLDMGRQLANMLRSEMPDIDSVEMGRVCLTLATYLLEISGDGPECPVVAAAADHIAATGFDLTSIEWEDSP